MFALIRIKYLNMVGVFAQWLMGERETIQKSYNIALLDEWEFVIGVCSR